jgi:hypothetical protein
MLPFQAVLDDSAIASSFPPQANVGSDGGVMRPLSSVHAGEVLVGNEVERRLPHAILWLPAKDTGVVLEFEFKT